MSEFDDIFRKPQTETTSRQYPPPAEAFDKEQWAANKQTERNEVYEMLDTATTKAVSNGDEFRCFLDGISHFDKYSAGNNLLILAQMPEATKLRDFDGWKEYGVKIKKNEKGIRILEPADEYTREDGTTGISYNVKRVFDISQTTAIKAVDKDKPTDLRSIAKILTQAAPVAVIISDKLPPQIGAEYDAQNGIINIRQGMGGADVIRALAQEIAHAELATQSKQYNRSEASFNAYCVSYAICKRTGVDVSSFSFDRLPERYSKLEPQEGRSELSKIRNATADLFEKMDAQREHQQEKAKIQPER